MQEHKIQLQEITAPLLEWYEKNARILPWRENTDPYRVWISEIMLQQTRVETVKPYFERFIRTLPSLRDLAGAEEEILLKLWEGLGYYTRVRNLQKAAQIICKNYNGIFPQEFEEILALPGIGPYTAGAISSISFGKPIPAVDGNVLRVMLRLWEDDRPLTDPTVKKQITEALTEIYPAGRCGDFTQSLMELGAVVCVPNGIPACDVCPLAHLCAANRSGTQLLFPVRGVKHARSIQEKTVFLLCCGTQVAVRKRAADGLLGGLWEFPNTAGWLTAAGAATWLAGEGILPKKLVKSARRRHIFTHVEWHMESYFVVCEQKSAGFTWVTREELETTVTLPTAFRKFTDCLECL